MHVSHLIPLIQWHLQILELLGHLLFTLSLVFARTFSTAIDLFEKRGKLAFPHWEVLWL